MQPPVSTWLASPRESRGNGLSGYAKREWNGSLDWILADVRAVGLMRGSGAVGPHVAPRETTAPRPRYGIRWAWPRRRRRVAPRSVSPLRVPLVRVVSPLTVFG